MICADVPGFHRPMKLFMYVYGSYHYVCIAANALRDIKHRGRPPSALCRVKQEQGNAFTI